MKRLIRYCPSCGTDCVKEKYYTGSFYWICELCGFNWELTKRGKGIIGYQKVDPRPWWGLGYRNDWITVPIGTLPVFQEESE